MTNVIFNMYLQDDALVLIRSDYKERAGRYVLLAREHGKIEARMEGARNIHSKLSGHVEPVCLAQVYLVKGRSGYKLIQTKLVKRYQFSGDTQWSFVWHLIESVNRLVPAEVPECELVDLLIETFGYLESGGKVTSGLWGFAYLNILYRLGYFPGNLLVSQELRKRAESFLSMNLGNGIVALEGNEEIISLVLNTVKEILQTENRSSGYLREVLKGK